MPVEEPLRLMDLFDALEESPLLPYAGTSGWSGSNTSRERARTADASGVTGSRQKSVLEALRAAGERGMTWKDVCEVIGGHHGSASGTLSVLHKEGLVARLVETRDRCKVYVLPVFTDGREVEAQGRRRECPNCGCEL